jgi:hypothetical protein
MRKTSKTSNTSSGPSQQREALSSMPATARAPEVSRDAMSARLRPRPRNAVQVPSTDYVFAREQNAQNHGKCGLLAQLA